MDIQQVAYLQPSCHMRVVVPLSRVREISRKIVLLSQSVFKKVSPQFFAKPTGTENIVNY